MECDGMQDTRGAMLGGMDVKKLLIQLAIPATIAMMANALYNLVDTIFVGRGAGEIAIGALGIVFPIQMIMMALALMVGMGSASIFSRAYGRDDQSAMRRSVNTALLMNLVISVIIVIVGLIYIDALLGFFGATQENFGYAKDYMVFILIAMVPFSSAIVLNNLARAEGRPKVAMITLLIGASVNIVLDPILIFGWFGLPEMGVRGAALATLIAKSLSFVYVLAASLQKSSNLGIDLRHLYKVDLPMTREIIAIGMPTLFRNVLGAFLVIIINRLINHYAPIDPGPGIYIAIYSVINRMIMFLLLPGFGLVQGLIPIVGYNFGAKLHKRLYDVIAFATRLIAIYFVAVFLVTLVSAEWLFKLFSREADPFFISEGARAFRIIAVGFTLIGFQFLLSSVYQAMGYPVRAFLVTMSRQFFLFIPLVFLFTFLFGISGIWLTFLTADILAGTLSFVIYRYEMRDLKKKIPQYSV
ncbi:MAG: MATE family efflux transporter [Acholeplasmatales bacterium]|nr:MAG: MATE family efflux transporter [Acholeplasmatales bacterium]